MQIAYDYWRDRVNNTGQIGLGGKTFAGAKCPGYEPIRDIDTRYYETIRDTDTRYYEPIHDTDTKSSLYGAGADQFKFTFGPSFTIVIAGRP